ncbi:tyrosine-type recombinase/integrase [Candidatus Bathyarchaeota archaeon]|nr:tyrosine-type recombinase/integrase [Candidatus Bathyarchaeota archaeon]
MNKVKEFLDNYDAPQTKRNFETSITQFFESVYGKKSIKNLEETVEIYFAESRNAAQDIKKFLKSLNGLAPLTIKLKVSNIKIFLLENDVELPQKFWKRLSRLIKGSRALTLDRIPTNDEFKKILSHVPIQGKALCLILESSGMRIGELLKSNIEDLYLNEEPARIQIRGENTKTGNSRHAFFSREAKEALVEWLKVRDGYLAAAVGKSHIYKKRLEDSRVFPFDPSTAYSIWKKALHKSGLNGKDKSTGREKIHPHVLRKLFRTRLGAVIPVDVVEALMGHEGYLTEVYRKYTVQDLAKFYLKGEAALLVFTDTQKVVELHKAIEEKNTQLQVLVNSLASENQNMKNEIFEMKDGMKRLGNFEVENLEIKSKVARVELENTETKKEMRELSLTVKSLIEKLEKLTQR